MKEKQQNIDRAIQKGITWRQLGELLTAGENPYFKKGSMDSHLASLRKNVNFHSRLRPDMARFIIDRLREKEEFTRRFGWQETTLRQTTGLFSALTEPPNETLAGKLRQRIFSEYPSIKGIFEDYKSTKSEVDIPTHIFLETFDLLFPNPKKREEIERSIRNAREKYGFSQTEYATLVFIMKGKTNKEIGRVLDISHQTVKNHVMHVFEKFNGDMDELDCEENDSWDKADRCDRRERAVLTALKEGFLPTYLLFDLPIATEIFSLNSLSDREAEILTLVKNGLVNKEIGRDLDISHQTVKNHMAAILRKLNCRSRLEALIIHYLYFDIIRTPERIAQAREEAANIPQKLREYMEETERVLNKGFLSRKIVACQLEETVGKVLGLGLSEYNLGCLEAPEYFYWKRRWEALRTKAAERSVKVGSFAQYAEKLGGFPWVFFKKMEEKI